MFDVISGENGSGIMHELEQMDSFEDEIPTRVNIGDTVELQINGARFLAEVSGIDGTEVEGVALKSAGDLDDQYVEKGQELQFSLMHIVRCIHPA